MGISLDSTERLFYPMFQYKTESDLELPVIPTTHRYVKQTINNAERKNKSPNNK